MESLLDPPSSMQAVTDSWAYTQFELRKHAFQWTLGNFRYITQGTGESVQSPIFPTNGKDKTQFFSLKLYPKGFNANSRDHLSLLLSVPHDPLSYLRPQISGTYQISILNSSKIKTNILQSQEVSRYTPDWGFKEFIRRDFLLENADQFLPDDKLTLCCEVGIVADPIHISDTNPIQAHEFSLSNELGKLLEGQKFTDVTLVTADGRELAAHKSILSARSPVFSNAFEYKMKESIQGRIEMQDMSHAVLQGMVYYIYTEQVPNLEKTAQDMLVAADKYALDHLKLMCEDYICKNLTVANAADILKLADGHNAEALKVGAIKFINMHASSVMNTDVWQEIERNCPRLVAEIFRALVTEQKSRRGPHQI